VKKRIANTLRVAVAAALLSGTLALPALATSVSTPDVALSNSVVGGLCNYTITFDVAKHLKAAARCAGVATVTAVPGAWDLPAVGDNMVFTAETTGDVVTLTPDPSASVNVALTGGAAYAAGVITFTAPNETATFTATAPVSGTWAQTAQSAVATVSAFPGAYALPEVGDAITFTSALATDDVTLTVTSGAVGVVMSGAGTYTAATGVIDFAAAGETTTVTATAAGAGTWAQTAGGPTVTGVVARAGTGTAATSNAAAARPWALPDTGDDITITTTGPDAGTIAVASGSVTATPTGAATVAGGAVGVPATITPLSGPTAWTVTAAGDTIKVEADVARSHGTWTIAGANANATVSGGGTAGTITVTFPTGTSLSNVTNDADADCTVGASSGIGLAALPVTPAASTVDGSKLKVTVPAASIGAAAIVQLVVSNVLNPPTTGEHTLTVKTSADSTPATSPPYTLTEPSVPALPGIVGLYNPAGIKMASGTGPTAIATLMAQAAEGFTLKIGPGTYTENIDSTAARQVFEATGPAAETTIIGRVTLGHSECTLQGLSIRAPTAYGTAVTITGDKALVQSNVFTKAGTAAWWFADAGPETIITYANATPSSATAGYGTITSNTFDTTLKQYYSTPKDDIVIDVNASGLTVSDNTFAVDSADIAIDASDGTTLYPTGTSGNTITGPGGTGIRVTGGHTDVSDTTMSGLGQALKVDGPTTDVTVKDSAISECGAGPSAANGWAGVPAILVNTTANLDITSSSITGGPNDIIEVQANANNVSIMSNDLSGNAKGIDNNDPVNTVNATLNWWGGAAGPAAGFNSGLVNAAGYTGTTTSSIASTTTSGTLKARDTQGIDVTITVAGAPWVPAAGDIIAVARYPANPHGETPVPALPDGFYDVLVTDSAGAAQTEVFIKLYNDAIADDTVAYVWSDLQGKWVPCSNQGSNASSGLIWIKVTAATDSVPAIVDLQGTPFALAEPVSEDPADLPPVAPTLLTPRFGEREAPVRPTFTWTASLGATTYELEVTQEIGLDDKFTITDYGATTTMHGHIANEALRYGTTYNWRVRGISDIGEGDWTTGFFTTIAEPEPKPEAVPPVVVEEVPAAPAPKLVVEMPTPETPVQVIQVSPDYLLWAVVGVGSVLLIGIIVLITRTRRVY